jgi:hypothetical protein
LYGKTTFSTVSLGGLVKSKIILVIGGKMASLKEIIKRFDAASRTLACTDKSLHDRLDGAIIEISSLDERDFNPDIRKGFRQVIEKIHAYRNSGDRSDMQSDTALSILEMCIRLHRETME